MSNWNSGYNYNADETENGFFWNTNEYFLIIKLNEVLKYSPETTEILVNLALSGKMKLLESITQIALYNETDEFKSADNASVSALFYVADRLGFKEELQELIVLSTIYEMPHIVEQTNILAEFLLNQDITTIENYDLSSFIQTAFDIKAEDIASLAALVSVSDKFTMYDGDPRYTISDFIIGVIDNYDNAYDWLLPFGLKIDWPSCTLSVMPEAELTTIEMPGVDGSIVEDAVYKDRLFNIVAFSEQGLDRQQKEALKEKIAQVLDSTKNQSKKLTIEPTSVSFDVRYEGQANIVDGPSYVKATIPLKTTPYGYDSFEETIVGEGSIFNYGDAPLCVKHTISGPLNQPRFRLGENTYTVNLQIAYNETLVIDHAMMSCYLIDSSGVKHNAMKHFTGKFMKIPVNTGEVLSIVGDVTETTKSKYVTTWTNKYLWKVGVNG